MKIRPVTEAQCNDFLNELSSVESAIACLRARWYSKFERSEWLGGDDYSEPPAAVRAAMKHLRKAKIQLEECGSLVAIHAATETP